MVLGSRGIIFTFDIFIAVLLLTLFSFMIFHITVPRSDHLRILSLSRLANDFLIVADRMGVLNTFDNETIGLFMNQTLSPKLHARMEADLYNKTLDVTQTVNVSRLDEPLPEEFVTSRRIVNQFNETGNLTHIGIFRFYLWWGDKIV